MADHSTLVDQLQDDIKASQEYLERNKYDGPIDEVTAAWEQLHDARRALAHLQRKMVDPTIILSR
jgi:hypothetical protein